MASKMSHGAYSDRSMKFVSIFAYVNARYFHTGDKVIQFNERLVLTLVHSSSRFNQ